MTPQQGNCHLVWLVLFAVGTVCLAQETVCPSGWTDSTHSGTCIKLYDEKKSWSDAGSACQEDDAHLVKIVNEDMNQFIWEHLSTHSQEDYWIGLHDKVRPNAYMWDDEREEAAFQNWAADEPKSHGFGRDCGEIGDISVEKGKWKTELCGEEAKFICEKPAKFSNEATCPVGWIDNTVSGSCVKAYDWTRSWKEARAVCKSSGADLVKIENSDDNIFIWRHVLIRSRDEYWIGLNDLKEENFYQWLDETDKAEYIKWNIGHSSTKNDMRDCVRMGGVTVVRQAWIDDDCSKSYKFICEKYVQGSTTESMGISTTQSLTTFDFTTSRTNAPPGLSTAGATTRLTTKTRDATTKIDQDLPLEKTSIPTTIDEAVNTTVGMETSTKSSNTTKQKSSLLKRGGAGLDAGVVAAISIIATLVACTTLAVVVVLARRFRCSRNAKITITRSATREYINDMYFDLQDMKAEDSSERQA